MPSQVWPAKQSPAPLHPQAPARQLLPATLVVQSVQASPAAPHAVADIPVAQVPLAQQPPLQRMLASHDVEHACVSGLQALPAGQSVLVQQPQCGPLVLMPGTQE